MNQFSRCVSARLLVLAVAATFAAGCSSSGEKKPDDQDNAKDNPFKREIDGNDIMRQKSDRILKLEADKLYAKAREALESADYKVAIERYDQLSSRYPFTDYATQGDLERIYAQYRSLLPDEASLAADRFLREHPRHPNADYVQYLKGLNDMGRDAGLIDYLPIDSSKRDIGNSRRAFDDFALLLQKYPTSRYAGDARSRMVFLRNRIASHELSVVRYYVKRGAWVAAAKRAESLIFEFPGAPATADALLALRECYTSLGLTVQADDVGRLIAANAASLEAANAKPAKAAGPVVASNPTPTSDAPPPERKGLVGAVLNGFDALNKTYTVGGEPATSQGANAPAGSQPPAAGGDTAAAAKAAAAPAPATDDAGKPKEKAGVFDFLNKTYTIGGSKPAADAAAAPTTPAPVARPEAANPPAAAPASTGKGFWQGIVDFFTTEHTLTLPSATPGPVSESSGPKLKATLEYPDAAESAPAKPQADAKPAEPAPAK